MTTLYTFRFFFFSPIRFSSGLATKIFCKTDDGSQRHRRRQSQPQNRPPTTSRPSGEKPRRAPNDSQHSQPHRSRPPDTQQTDTATRPREPRHSHRHKDRNEPRGAGKKADEETRPQHQRRAARRRSRKRHTSDRERHDQQSRRPRRPDRQTNHTTNTPRQTDKTRQPATTATGNLLDCAGAASAMPRSPLGAALAAGLRAVGGNRAIMIAPWRH